MRKARASLHFHNARMNHVHGCCRRFAAACALALSGLAWGGTISAPELAVIYVSSVDRKLVVPPEETQRYAGLAELAFGRASIRPAGPQYVLVVDRDPHVQAALLLWRSGDGVYQLVGASPVSTGAPGTFDHFQTPLGVFEHGPWNPDFRAEGTFNQNGIRGYGGKGMRVFDFGWQRAPKGWGDGAPIDMRLQMHATDPDALEPRLGSAQSKGCVRIPGTLNRLLDHYGVLDANYEEAAAEGRAFWVLDPQGEPVAAPGRYVVVVDSGLSERPEWSPMPVLRHVPLRRNR